MPRHSHLFTPGSVKCALFVLIGRVICVLVQQHSRHWHCVTGCNAAACRCWTATYSVHSSIPCKLTSVILSLTPG